MIGGMCAWLCQGRFCFSAWSVVVAVVVCARDGGGGVGCVECVGGVSGNLDSRLHTPSSFKKMPSFTEWRWKMKWINPHFEGGNNTAPIHQK